MTSKQAAIIFLTIAGLFLLSGSLGMYAVNQRIRADRLEKKLTATVAECADAWLAAPVKGGSYE